MVNKREVHLSGARSKDRSELLLLHRTNVRGKSKSGGCAKIIVRQLYILKVSGAEAELRKGGNGDCNSNFSTNDE